MTIRPRVADRDGVAHNISRQVMETVVGRLILTATDRGLSHIERIMDVDGNDVVGVGLPPSRGALRRTAVALAEAGQTRPNGGRVDPTIEGSREGRGHLRVAERALDRYFAGASRDFAEIALAPEGTTFQHEVWNALRRIPFGTTVSYMQLAERIGRARAVRAVGLANGRNPLPIVVPCHRVIGADRSLTGFGLGLPVKAWLLVHEGAAEPFRAPLTVATRVEPIADR